MTEVQRERKRNYQRVYRSLYPDRVRASMRAWRETHRGEIKAYNHNYRKAFPERIKALCCAWREDHREEVRVYNSHFRATNPDRVRTASRTWKENHTDQVKSYGHFYLKAHPEQIRARNHKRRALIRGNGGHYTIEEWELLKAVYNYRCPKCGKSEPEIKLTVDHVIPIARGGTSFIENIQPLCLKCNDKKQTKVVRFDPIKEKP